MTLLPTMAALLPVLHVSRQLPSGPYWTSWSVEPTVALGVVALIAAYLAWTGPLSRRRPGVAERPVSRGQIAAFVGGSLTLLVALGPPLDDWADHFLVSAHMVQHLLLVLVVAPLWLLGTPAWLLRPLLRHETVARVGYALTRPVPAFVIANFVFALWHEPALYDAALRSEPLHVVEHLLFLGTALLAWWPIVGPLPEWPRLAAPLQCVYLFFETLPGGLVGAFLTLGAPGIYSPYVSAPRMWGISVATDQQIAGLLMWVATSTIYLLLVTVIFFRWAGREDAAEQAAAGNQPSAIGSR